MKEEKATMTTREVAEFLNTHPMTIRKYAKEGKIPAFKIGSDWRFYKESIKAWIKDKEKYNREKRERRKDLR